jgi:hypothetical protein
LILRIKMGSMEMKWTPLQLLHLPSIANLNANNIVFEQDALFNKHLTSEVGRKTKKMSGVAAQGFLRLIG